MTTPNDYRRERLIFHGDWLLECADSVAAHLKPSNFHEDSAKAQIRGVERHLKGLTLLLAGKMDEYENTDLTP